MKVTRTERGWPGHFCGAHKCLFRRNTLLTCGDIRIVVSTVGAYGEIGQPIMEIGCERYYETMAFHAVIDKDGYCDAETSREINFDVPWSIDAPYRDAAANAMHEAVVKELSKRMASGETLA